jgi:hypothetical protein
MEPKNEQLKYPKQQIWFDKHGGIFFDQKTAFIASKALFVHGNQKLFQIKQKNFSLF